MGLGSCITDDVNYIKCNTKTNEKKTPVSYTGKSLKPRSCGNKKPNLFEITVKSSHVICKKMIFVWYKIKGLMYHCINMAPICDSNAFTFRYICQK